MFKQYVMAGHQNNAIGSQALVGVDLMTITSYTRTPAQLYTHLIGPGLNTQVYMTQTDFEEFCTNLKTANRLKRVYE